MYSLQQWGRSALWKGVATHRSSWAEPEAPGPRRDFSSQSAKGRGEATLLVTSCADSSCASTVLHEGASRRRKPATKHHNQFAWQATLLSNSLKVPRSKVTARVLVQETREDFFLLFSYDSYGRLYSFILFFRWINLVNRQTGLHSLFCVKWQERQLLVQRYKLHRVNFRFLTPMWISMSRILLQSFSVTY